MMKPEIADWGLIPYEEAWNRQKEWFNEVVAAKQAGQPCHNRIVLRVVQRGGGGQAGGAAMS